MTTGGVSSDLLTVDPRICDAVEAAVAAAGGSVSDLAVMPGGHSGVTLSGRLDLGDGARDVVFKVAPPDAKAVGRHDVLRQAAAIEALSGTPGLAIPEVVLRRPGPPDLFAMEFVEGDSREPVLDGTDASSEQIDARARAAARMLATLHSVPVSGSGLEGEPALSIPDELDRWQKLMGAVPEELCRNAGTLMVLLRAVSPERLPPVLLHGDYRLGNTLAVGTSIRSVIDWEIWSVGDPRVDLAWFRMFCDASNFPGAAVDVAGMPSASELQREYERARGVQLPSMTWFDAFAGYKMAAIMGYNLRRHREGRHHDPYQETLVPTISHLVDHGVERLSQSYSPR